MSTPTELNKEVAIKFWKGLRDNFQGRPVDLLPFVTDDFEWTIPAAMGGSVVGKEEALKRIPVASTVFPADSTTKMEFVQWVADDESVALHFTVEANMVGTGELYKNYYMAMMRVRDGLLCQLIETYDTEHARGYVSRSIQSQNLESNKVLNID